MLSLGPTEMHLLLALNAVGNKATSSQLLPLLGLTYLNISRRHALWRLIDDGLVYETWPNTDSCSHYALTPTGLAILASLNKSNLTTQ